ncbi:uncharacterized protein TEOVI_000633300 [Trypanosoma equiperdum]|uniref:Wings apart-like protein C-terminal domain-containing protein n=2 Tax=Trypanozoon TaxID=39700 RepID=Q57US6_TRYB2|nr:hypothetical protein, conserved [Trypanosoma brucei brucei TREU927]AAX70613.1 hypothetical protein, conserved [Trypanosoma brucei]AAZ10640.1 hypothetical protein, conserved [Trypanosoma brucei brucei TREU927]SCU65927.1 hypothetical protein, conserved [Trypanosoma equiperdum]
MSKRKRCMADVVGYLDSFMACKRTAESPPLSQSSDGEAMQLSLRSDTSNENCSSSSGGSVPGPDTMHIPTVNEARVRLVKRADSPRLRGSVFETEMNFFCREEENIADMCVYLAEVASSSRTPEALMALVLYFMEHEPDMVMQSLKRAGLQSQLLSALCKSSARSVTDNKEGLYIRFVGHLLTLCDDEVLSDASLVKFFLLSSEKRAEEAAATPAGSKHWSQRAHCPTPPKQRRQDDSALKSAVDKFCRGKSDDTATSLALKALLHIIFRYNQATSFPGEANPCLVFAELGGFEVVTPMLNDADCKDVLHLLEVVTLCERLCPSYDAALQELVILLIRLVAREDTKCENDVLTIALRVLVNGTSLVPHALRDSNRRRERSQLAEFSTKRLMSDNTPLNVAAFILCSAVNIVKWEVASRCDEFARCLVNCPDFLSRIAELTLQCYNAEETERNVVSGYYALLLAVLSLIDTPKVQLRVPVITAVAQATKGTETGKAVESKPMKLIVAILQEFLLFQSTAGSLTKSGLVSMSTIIESVVKCNGIEISSDS